MVAIMIKVYEKNMLENWAMILYNDVLGRNFMILYYVFERKGDSKPMSLVLEDVKRVANLARIEISDEEAHITLGQLTGIFYLIEQMQAVNTSTIIPMSHAQDVVQRLRIDVVTEADQHELFQSLAPQVEARALFSSKGY